jgi:hypothetical protein
MKNLLYLFFIVLLVSANVIYSQKQKDELSRIKKETLSAEFKIANMAAFSDGNGVYLRWETESENGILGFYLYRGSAKGIELISPKIIPGGALRSNQADNQYGNYVFFDAQGDLGSFYYIEIFRINGQRELLSPVFPQYINDLTEVSGYSSAQLKSSAENVVDFQEKSELKYPVELKKQYEENYLSPDINTQRWVAAQPGVKITVKERGLYRVTRAELANAGFDVNTPANLWQLYVDGKEQSISVGENDSYIEFYGEGMDTVESGAKVYYLIVGTSNGKRIESKPLRNIGANVISRGYQQSWVRQERSMYLSGILNGDDGNFFGSVLISGSSTTPQNFNINVPSIDFSVAKAHVEISLQGITINQHQVRVSLNGEEIGVMNWYGKNLKRETFGITASMLQEGANTIQLRALAGSNDFSLLESIRIDYSRKYEAAQNQLFFYTSNYRAANLSGFSSPNIRVLDLSFPDTPSFISNLNITNDNGNYIVRLPSHRGRVMYAVEGSAIKTASSITPNYPSSLSTPNHNAQMIIVTHRDWLAEANTWKNYRIAQGMSVEVVDITDIFDEFSYGSQSTDAMREFFNYAKNNWQTPPNYILLIGDATYDFRNYENNSFQSWVLTRLVDTLYEETGSDEALTDFNNDGLVEIPIGRIPARNAADVTRMLNKVIAFEANLTNAMNRGALFVSDLPIGYDFEAVNARLSAYLPAEMPKNFIPRSNSNARNLLLADLNNGRYLVNYSGHGSTSFWAASNFYHKNDIPLLSNPNDRLTIFTLLTCLNGYFISPTIESFAEASIRKEPGGAVITWASSGQTTPDIQEVMATRFFMQFSAGNITRIGDLVRDAKQVISGGRDVRLTWTLFGDPAIRIR